MMNAINKNQNNAAWIYRFGEFSFDADEQILSRYGETVQLPPKTCELLNAFLENSGKLLSKDDLMNLVW